MKKNKKIIVIIAATLVLLMVVSAMMPLFEGMITNAASSISDLESQLDKLNDQKKHLEKEIASGKTEIEKVQKEISIINAKISVTQEKIDVCNELVKQLDEQIKESEIRLNAAEKEITEEYSAYKQRVKRMYEKGNTNYLEVILSATSFSDLLTRMDFVEKMVSYEQDVLKRLEIKKNEIKKLKAEIEEKQKNAVAAKQEVVNEKNQLVALKNKSAALKSKLAKEQDKMKAEYAKIEKQEAQIKAAIKKLLEEQNNGDYVGGAFLWPLSGRYSLTDVFGYRVHPITGQYKLHTGVDIPAPKGTSVKAANSGVVIKAESSDAYGNYVVIDHGGGKATLYAHNTSLAVKKGDKVTRGQVISYVGATGYATGNHLHFEILINGTAVNPVGYFPNIKFIYI